MQLLEATYIQPLRKKKLKMWLCI